MTALMFDGEQWIDIDRIEAIEDVKAPDRFTHGQRAVTTYSGRVFYSTGTAIELATEVTDLRKRLAADAFLRDVSLNDGSTQKMSGHGDL